MSCPENLFGDLNKVWELSDSTKISQQQLVFSSLYGPARAPTMLLSS
jgi:hypothetical protein